MPSVRHHNSMTPRRWALLAWGAFLVLLIAITAPIGRDCTVPSWAPPFLHRMLVPIGGHRQACSEENKGAENADLRSEPHGR